MCDHGGQGTCDHAAILVVDDDPASTSLLRITLGMDHTVYTANSGEAGLELLAAHPEIALAIIDQRMPGMTGTGSPGAPSSPIRISYGSS